MGNRGAPFDAVGTAQGTLSALFAYILTDALTRKTEVEAVFRADFEADAVIRSYDDCPVILAGRKAKRKLVHWPPPFLKRRVKSFALRSVRSVSAMTSAST